MDNELNKQSNEAARDSGTVDEGVRECECAMWCDNTHEERILTGHHKMCPRATDPFSCALDLISEMASGMELWASDEDGIHSDCWKPYCKAKALEGVFLNPNE